MERKYTYAEAAERLGIAEITLRHWVSAGKISCEKLGRFVRFSEDDLKSAYKPVPARPSRQRAPRRRP